MKKLFCIFMALAMAGLCAIPVFAQNTAGGSTTISTEVAPAYTVRIPARLEIPYGSRDAREMKLTASGLLLESGKSVVITAAGSGAEGAFVMRNGEKSLGYELSKTASPWNAVTKNGEVASFSKNGTASVYAKVPDWSVTAAGAYSGAITFTVAYQ